MSGKIGSNGKKILLVFVIAIAIGAVFLRPDKPEPEIVSDPLPANIIIKDVIAAPRSLQTGEVSTITVDLENTGDLEGTKLLVLYINDHLGGTETVSIEGGKSKDIQFTIEEDEPGFYTAKIGELSTTINYIEPEPEIPELTPEPEEPHPNTEPGIPSPQTVDIDVISTCTKIVDGDTFETTGGFIIRLADVDAPEISESGYQDSKNALSDLIYGQRVYLDVDDVYGFDNQGSGYRYVCVVYLENGLNINQKMVNEGYVEVDDHSNEFAPNDWSLQNNLETSAVGEFEEPESEEPEPEPQSDPHEEWLNEGPFWGSKKSDKYHEPSCYCAKQISPENLIIFSTRRQAINKGYIACKVCKP